MEQVYFTPREAAEYTRLSIDTLAQRRWLKQEPRFCRVVNPGGVKPIIRYRREDLDAWLTGNQV